MDRALKSYEWDAWYAGNKIQKWWKRSIGREISNQLFGYGDLKLLDIGCGSSPQMLYYPVKTVVGVDIDLPKLRFIRGRTSQRFQFCSSSGCHLPFKSETFDRVVVCEVMEHLDSTRIEGLILEISRVLKRKGLVTIAVPEGTSPLWALLELIDRIVHRNGHCSDHHVKFNLDRLQKLLLGYGYFLLKHSKVARCDIVATFWKE